MQWLGSRWKKLRVNSTRTFSMITLDYSLPADDLVKVCPWCWPLDSIKERFPHLKPRRIIHRICSKHEEQQASYLPRLRAVLYGAHTRTL